MLCRLIYSKCHCSCKGVSAPTPIPPKLPTITFPQDVDNSSVLIRPEIPLPYVDIPRIWYSQDVNKDYLISRVELGLGYTIRPTITFPQDVNKSNTLTRPELGLS